MITFLKRQMLKYKNQRLLNIAHLIGLDIILKLTNIDRNKQRSLYCMSEKRCYITLDDSPGDSGYNLTTNS